MEPPPRADRALHQGAPAAAGLPERAAGGWERPALEPPRAGGSLAADAVAMSAADEVMELAASAAALAIAAVCGGALGKRRPRLQLDGDPYVEACAQLPDDLSPSSPVAARRRGLASPGAAPGQVPWRDPLTAVVPLSPVRAPEVPLSPYSPRGLPRLQSPVSRQLPQELAAELAAAECERREHIAAERGRDRCRLLAGHNSTALAAERRLLAAMWHAKRGWEQSRHAECQLRAEQRKAAAKARRSRAESTVSLKGVSPVPGDLAAPLARSLSRQSVSGDPGAQDPAAAKQQQQQQQQQARQGSERQPPAPHEQRPTTVRARLARMTPPTASLSTPPRQALQPPPPPLPQQQQQQQQQLLSSALGSVLDASARPLSALAEDLLARTLPAQQPAPGGMHSPPPDRPPIATPKPGAASPRTPGASPRAAERSPASPLQQSVEQLRIGSALYSPGTDEWRVAGMYEGNRAATSFSPSGLRSCGVLPGPPRSQEELRRPRSAGYSRRLAGLSTREPAGGFTCAPLVEQKAYRFIPEVSSLAEESSSPPPVERRCSISHFHEFAANCSQWRRHQEQSWATARRPKRRPPLLRRCNHAVI